jgi:hypothetical protein
VETLFHESAVGAPPLATTARETNWPTSPPSKSWSKNKAEAAKDYAHLTLRIEKFCEVGLTTTQLLRL